MENNLTGDEILEIINKYEQELEDLRAELVEAFGSHDEGAKYTTIQCVTISILKDRIIEANE